MEKGSFSLSMLRWLEDMVEVGDFCQKLFFSVGEGYWHPSAPLCSCNNGNLLDITHGEIDTTIIDDCLSRISSGSQVSCGW